MNYKMCVGNQKLEPIKVVYLYTYIPYLLHVINRLCWQKSFQIVLEAFAAVFSSPLQLAMSSHNSHTLLLNSLCHWFPKYES